MFDKLHQGMLGQKCRKEIIERPTSVELSGWKGNNQEVGYGIWHNDGCESHPGTPVTGFLSFPKVHLAYNKVTNYR